MSEIMAIANQKGGVGKTTTTINLSAALAEKGNGLVRVEMVHGRTWRGRRQHGKHKEAGNPGHTRG